MNPATPSPNTLPVPTTSLNTSNATTDSTLTMYNQYLRGPLVGGGQHGQVYQCYDTARNRQEVAIKIVKRNNPRAEKMSQLRKQNKRNNPSASTSIKDRLGPIGYKISKEIAIMKKCRHPHVVELLEIIDDKHNERILMVMEYLGGGEIKWKTSMGEPTLHVNQSRRICRDVILGLEYLHYQGIIHRDIKPANLLWTTDRRAVKITDFGVSHFSYAQRIAAAGQSRAELDDSNDPILLDDSDLSKTAGTPTFLAPEVISEPVLVPASTTNLNCSSSTVQLVARKPPITNMIDVWALGCTLFCLLFGHPPFQAPEDDNPSPIHGEYMLYEAIRSQDWSPDETMGYDCIPTGGRHPNGQDTEGEIVVEILDRMLQKDVSKRARLDDLKRHPWFLRDIHHPQEWLRKTSPKNHDMLVVTDIETSTAMSPLRFSWFWNKDRLKDLFRNVRPRRSRSPRIERDTVGIRSAPYAATSYKSASVRTRNSIPTTSGASTSNGKTGKVDKGKRRADSHQNLSNSKSEPPSPGRSRSIERWPIFRSHGGGSSATLSGSLPKARRGSETLLVPPRTLHFASQQPSPTLESDRTQRQQTTDERTRKGFSLLKPWRLHSYYHKSSSPQHSPPSQDITPASSSSSPGVSRSSTSSSPHGISSAVSAFTRRSEEGLRRHGILPRRSNSSGRLTAARRASSWGDPADYVADAMSVHATERVDEETMFVGAGGVVDGQIPFTPSMPQSLASTSSGAGSSTPLRLQQEHLYGSNGAPSTPDPGVQDVKQLTQLRSTMTSPLSQEISRADESRGADYESEDEEDIDDDDDDYSSLEENVSTSQRYADDDDDDDDDDDEETRPLEYRRRPSVSVTAASPPPHSDSDDE